MRRKRLVKLIASILCFIMIESCMIAPVHAWKLGTHVYSGNLLLDDLKDGYVDIPPFGQFKVLPEYKEAIEKFPDFYRAGCIGPDAFPDIYIGQAFIHPGIGAGKLSSGQWIDYLWDETLYTNRDATKATTWFPGGINPNSSKLNKTEYESSQRRLAFALGFVSHASGDLFGHSYVNEWAGGPFPTVTDGLTVEEGKNIVRHNAVEAYIDKRIPKAYTDAERKRISIPQDFILKHMITNNGVINHSDMWKNTNDINPIYAQYGSTPKHLDIFFGLYNYLKKDIPKNTGIKKPIGLYEQAWLKDIDEGLAAWVYTSEKIARDMLAGDYAKAKDDMMDWALNHYLSMMGLPDAMGKSISYVNSALDKAAALLPEFLRQAVKQLKDKFADLIFEWAFSIKYTEIKKIFENPENYIYNSAVFGRNDVKAQLEADMGNFATATNPDDISFEAFYNTIIMIKLNLIGLDGVNELIKKAGQEGKQLRRNSYKLTILHDLDVPPIIFIKSLDVGYDKKNPSFEGFKLWDDTVLREKVFWKIFKNKPINETPSNVLPAKGYLDAPAEGQFLSGIYNVFGWFLDGNGVNKIEVLVDGAMIGTADYGQVRLDVRAKFPEYQNEYCGYSYKLDTTKLTKGSHSITIRETGNNSVQTSLPTITFTVSNKEKIYKGDKGRIVY